MHTDGMENMGGPATITASWDNYLDPASSGTGGVKPKQRTWIQRLLLGIFQAALKYV